MSTHEVKGKPTALRRAPLRWCRSRWFLVLPLACCLLLAGGVYLHWSHTGPEPPTLEGKGLDPVIVAAAEEARGRVRQSPRSAAAWGRLGLVLVAHGFRADANVCLAKAERLDPREPRWPYFQALGALAVGDGESALPNLERTVALCGDKLGSPRLRLADLLLSLERLDEAEHQYRHLLERNPRHTRAQLGLAKVFFQRGNPRESLAPLRFAQNDSRTRKAAYQLLAQVQRQLGNQAQAEEAQRWAARQPDDPFWPDPLFEELTEARTGKEVWMDRAKDLALKGKVDEAIAVCQQTVRAYPDADEPWLQLGLVYLVQKNQPAAEEAFRRATELAPASAEDRFYLGNALALRGDVAGGISCFRKAVELKPDYVPAYHTLGNCLTQTGDLTGAIGAYRAAVRYEPSLFEVQLILATLLAENGAAAEALVHAQQALRLKPSDPRAQKLMERLPKLLVVPFFVP